MNRPRQVKLRSRLGSDSGSIEDRSGYLTSFVAVSSIRAVDRRCLIGNHQYGSIDQFQLWSTLTTDLWILTLGLAERTVHKTGAGARARGAGCACPVPRLRAGADLDGLHRGLGLGLGLVDHAVGADDRRFGRNRLLVNDRALLRLQVLHDVIGRRPP